MATHKSPDMTRDPADPRYGMGSDAPIGAQESGSPLRAGEATGPQTYAASGGSTSMRGSARTGGRDFYREALARVSTRDRDLHRSGRDFNEDTYRPLGRREEFVAGGYTRGDVEARYAGAGYDQGRSEAWRGNERDWREVLRERERDSGELRDRRFQHEDLGEDTERRSLLQRAESHMPGGRTMAMAAAGLGAVGLGLMRRGRWAREPLCARELMSVDVKSVLPEHSIRDVARLMREESVGIVPVTDSGGRLLGLVTDRDLVVRAVLEDRLPSQVRVADVMSSEDIAVATPDESVHDIIEVMGRKQVRRIPVVERDNRLVGIIAMADIATRADEDEELQEALARISQRRSFWSRLS